MLRFLTLNVEQLLHLFALLLVSHHLELIHLLQLGDLEGSMGLAGLHLKIVDLHVSLLDLVLFVKLLAEDNTALVVELLAQDREVILAHGSNIRKGSNLFEHSLRNTHLGVLYRTDVRSDLGPPTRTRG